MICGIEFTIGFILSTFYLFSIMQKSQFRITGYVLASSLSFLTLAFGAIYYSKFIFTWVLICSINERNLNFKILLAVIFNMIGIIIGFLVYEIFYSKEDIKNNKDIKEKEIELTF